MATIKNDFRDVPAASLYHIIYQRKTQFRVSLDYLQLLFNFSQSEGQPGLHLICLFVLPSSQAQPGS